MNGRNMTIEAAAAHYDLHPATDAMRRWRHPITDAAAVCDGCGSWQLVRVPQSEIAKSEQQAIWRTLIPLGWQFSRDRNFCPNCAKK